MSDFELKRKHLNQQQTKLREMMAKTELFSEAIQMFLKQHAMLHSVKINTEDHLGDKIWSYEDSIMDGISDEQFRKIPAKCEHSVAWCIWHITRIEDIAMNILIADTSQVLYQDNWYARINVEYRDTGNAMNSKQIALLGETIDIKALLEYRLEVGRRTAEIVKTLDSNQLRAKVDPTRIQRVKDEGAVLEAAYGITDYWSKRNNAGLLLMPATRHLLVHLNEANQLKNKRR